MTAATITGVGVLGPGLPGWAASQPILAGRVAWQAADVALPPPALLPTTERRRAGPVARLALAVATEAATAAGLPPTTLRPVFGSGNGDAITVCAILDVLSQADGLVSPTQFHNSVHNAAAGYWSIATASASPATVLGCHDWTFAAALMKALAECVVEAAPVLLCVYDVPMPAPLHAKRPLGSTFGMALVLVPDGPGPRVGVRWHGRAGGSEPLDPALRPLAAGNPAARSLRLLEALAREEADTFELAVLDGTLDVAVSF